MRDARRAQQVGHQPHHRRGGVRAARGEAPPAAGDRHHVGAHGAQRRSPVRALYVPRRNRRPEPCHGRHRGPAGAPAKRPPEPEHALCDPVPDTPAALPDRGQRPRPGDPRLCLLRREPVALPAGAGGLPGDHRLPEPAVRIAVVGAGSWGTAFSRLLAVAGHEVVLEVDDPEQAAAINQHHRNPRYLYDIALPPELTASTLDEAELAAAGMVAIAVPSRAYGEIVAGLGRRLDAETAVLSMTKGLDPASHRRLSELLEPEVGA